MNRIGRGARRAISVVLVTLLVLVGLSFWAADHVRVNGEKVAPWELFR